MKKIISILLLFSFSKSNAQWTYIKPMPKPLSKHTATVYNGKIYVFGNKYTFMYDPSQNLWQTIDTSTKIGDYKSAVTIKDKIYITGDKITLVFNPKNNDWDTLNPEIPEIMRLSCSVALNNKLYVMAGDIGTKFLNTVLVYNPDSNKWTYKSKMNTARRLPSASVAEGKIYVTGGFAYEILSVNEIYDPQTDQWEYRTLLPSRRYQHVQGNVNVNGKEKFFIAGGYNDIELIDFHIYDPQSDVWYKMKDMIEFRYRFSAVSIDNCVYVFGGFNSSGYDRATAEKICITTLDDLNLLYQDNSILFPNPSTGVLNFNITENFFSIEIYDSECRKILCKLNSGNKLDLSGNPKGLYYFILKEKNKIIKGKFELI